MKKLTIVALGIILFHNLANAQSTDLNQLEFLLGKWTGIGSGFGNDKSIIESNFQLVLDGKYMEVVNESNFDPTEKNPKGEHHLDKGFISFDKNRGVLVFRQFNNEGYFNQYVLVDTLSKENTLVFVTEFIENFVPGGKARWTIQKISENEIETTFDVSFPNKDYTCFGRNYLIKE